jgi:hypothetical protein
MRQIEVEHARGFGNTDARSTFVMFYVMDYGSVWRYPHCLSLNSYDYELGTPEKIEG